MTADREGTAMEVIGGTNLPVVLDAYMSRTVIADAGQLAASSSANGRQQVIHYVMTAETDSIDDDEIEYDE
jgi:mannose/fructose-specific phosphotransferase system component IIA